jgi:LacI family transcriptional regulator
MGIDTENGKPQQPVSLKTLAEYLDLSPATVSLVLNDSPRAKSIPQSTKDRVLAAAKAFDYRPNFFARYLNTKRTYTVAVIVPEVGEGYGASVVGGIERRLVRNRYSYLLASHRWIPELIEDTPKLLMDRGAEGFILVNMPLEHPLPTQVVDIGGHIKLPSVTNIRLDNRRASYLALEHLVQLGHSRIAFFLGHTGSADTDERCEGIYAAAEDLGIKIDPDLTVQLQRRGSPPLAPTPDEGYIHARKLLDRKVEFTALFAFNDISAIGAMAAFRDAGLSVPHDVSVVGFDDIQAAAYVTPQLTTVRQPLHHMGELAAKELLRRIDNRITEPAEILVQPELIVRESTAEAPQKSRTAEAHAGQPRH